GPLLLIIIILIFFNLFILFKNIMASDFSRRSYSGPNYFVDNPREFYELDA
ncbi:hypothetical protein QBC45DRAFT_339211, partial [Copromyces sp. CBS 386.78]